MRKRWSLIAVVTLGLPFLMLIPGRAGEHGRDEHAGEAKVHQAENGHAGEHAGHGEERGQAAAITLSPAQIKLSGIRTRPILRGEIRLELALIGEVALNQDKVVHIAPRVPGIVQQVIKTLGNHVRAGEVMAVLASSELAEAEAAYLAAGERKDLAKSKYVREKTLWEKKVGAEQEYLEAKQEYAEAGIQLRTAKQKLLSLGFSAQHLARLASRLEEPHMRHEITAPFDGTIIEKHITLGELVDKGAELYTICDLNIVWVMAKVYEKDLARVKIGQTATFKVMAYPQRTFGGEVTWISATIDKETRTLAIRVRVDNRHRLLKPGMFTRVALGVDTKENVLTIPVSALLTQKDEFIVFIAKDGGRFERREVKVGLRSSTIVEILDGVREGEKVVTNGGFILKSELEKEGFEAGHAGH